MAEPRVYYDPPSQRTKHGLCTANAQCQRFSAYYGTAAIFKLSYFLCGLFPTLYSTLLFCLKHLFFSGINLKSKELLPTLHSPNKKPLHSNHHHRSAYASIKNVGSYINIMWHYSTAFSPACASTQTHSLSYNNIMLSIQHHRRYQKIFPNAKPNANIFWYRSRVLTNRTHPKNHNSPPPFQRSEKK